MNLIRVMNADLSTDEVTILLGDFTSAADVSIWQLISSFIINNNGDNARILEYCNDSALNYFIRYETHPLPLEDIGFFREPLYI